jgi:hypothetical protein
MQEIHPARSAFEADAEIIAVYRLDLIAQLEAQLRAVHRTLRSLERLRQAGTRGARNALATLASEIRAIDRELQAQHESCISIQDAIHHMQVRLGY